MAESSALPPISSEHRKVAVGQFERAQQVTSTGDYDYGIQLLLSCCKLDPANLIYRRYLRQVEKNKYQNNLRGSRMALLTTSASKARLKSAKRAGEFLKVLEQGEEVLTRNPWDTGAQLDMAEAADALGLLDVAAWILEQARQKDPKNAKVNRSLARLYEKRGQFNQAIKLWELVREADPADAEARSKSKDLAASDTIARGQYGQAGSGEVRPAAATARKEPGAEQPAPPPQRTASSGGDRMSREAEPLRARIAADPGNANAYLHLAALHRRADQFDQARAVLVEGLGATGHHFDLSLALADLDIELFRRDLSHTEERLRRRPDDPELCDIRRQLLKEIHTRELDFHRQKADRYPNEKGHRFEVGVRLLHLGQVDEAIKELQPLRAEARYQWKALMYLGYCFKNRNNWRLAQRNFEEALQNLPATEIEARKDILYQLAQGCAAAGELGQALDLGHELAHLDFGYRDIGRLLDDWQHRLQEET